MRSAENQLEQWLGCRSVAHHKYLWKAWPGT